MTRLNVDDLTSTKLLKFKRTFAYFNTNLSLSTTVSNKKIFTELHENLDSLKKGFKYYNRSSTGTSEVIINEVKISDLTFKIYDNERKLVTQLSKKLNIDLKLSFTLFKQFLASNADNKEWINYVLDSNCNAIITDRKLKELESKVKTEFTNFYFTERLACFQILSKLVRINQNIEHPNSEQANKLLDSLRASDNEVDLVHQLLDQLDSEILMVKSLIQPKYLSQLFSEYHVLLEYITLSIDDDVPFTAVHVNRYIKWLLKSGTKKIVDPNLIGANHYTSAIIAETCETSLLLHFLQFDKISYYCDTASDELPVLAEEPKVFIDIIQDLIKSSAVPSDCITYRAIAMLSLSTKLQFENLPQKSESQQYFLDKLDSGEGKMCAAEKLFSIFDPILVYKQLLELLRCPLLESKSKSSLPFKMSFRLFLMAVAIIRPREFIKNAQLIVKCLTSLYLDDVEMCEYFWIEDFNTPSRKRFLQLTTTYFPVYHQPLLQLLRALSGASASSSSTQSVADYLMELTHFAQKYSNSLKSVIKISRPPDSNIFCVLAKKNIDLIDIPGFTKFTLDTGTRGCLATSLGGDSTYILWSYKYSLFDYLLCMLDGLIDSSDTYHRLQESSQFVSGCLSVLTRITSDDPTLLATLVNLEIEYTEELPADHVFVHRITGLLDLVLNGPDSLYFLLPITLQLLGNLIPAYPTVIVGYLTLNHYKFIQLKHKGSILKHILRVDLPSRQYGTTISYLEFILNLCTFLSCQATLDLDSTEYSTFNLIKQFLKRTLPVLVENIYYYYIHWQYVDNVQRSKIGRLCLQIFNTFFQLNPDILQDKFEDQVQLFGNYFFNSEKVSYYTPILSLLAAAGKLILKFESLYMVQPAQETIKVLDITLTFLNNLFKYNLYANTALQLVGWSPFTLFAFEMDKQHLCPVNSLLNLLDTRFGSKITLKAATLLTCICSQLNAHQDLSLLSAVQPNFNRIAANLHYLLEGNAVDQPCKRALWIFISATHAYQPVFFEALFNGNSTALHTVTHRFNDAASNQRVGNQLSLSDLCLEMVDMWDTLVQECPWVALVFVQFLSNLWSNKFNCTDTLDTLADRIGLFPFIHKLLINSDEPQDSVQAIVADATAGFAIQITLSELIYRSTATTDSPLPLGSDLNQVLQLLTQRQFLYRQFTNVNKSKASDLVNLKEKFNDAEFDPMLLENFSNYFLDAHYCNDYQFGYNFSYDAISLFAALQAFNRNYESTSVWHGLKFELEQFNLTTSRLLASLNQFRVYCDTLLALIQSGSNEIWNESKLKFDLAVNIVREFSRMYDLESDASQVTPVLAAILANFVHQLVQLTIHSDWSINSVELHMFYLETADVILDAITLDGEMDYDQFSDRSSYCQSTTQWYISINLLVCKFNLTPHLLDNVDLHARFENLKVRAINLITQDFQIVEGWLNHDTFPIISEPFYLVETALNLINSLTRDSKLDLNKCRHANAYVGFLIRLLDLAFDGLGNNTSKLVCNVLNILNLFKEQLELIEQDNIEYLVKLLQNIQVPDPSLSLEPQFVYSWAFNLQLLQAIIPLNTSNNTMVAELITRNWKSIHTWIHNVQQGFSKDFTTPLKFSEILLVLVTIDSISKNVQLLSEDLIARGLVQQIHSLLPKLVDRLGNSNSTLVNYDSAELQFSRKFQIPYLPKNSAVREDFGVVVLHQLAVTSIHFINAYSKVIEKSTVGLNLTTFNRTFHQISFGTLIDLIVSLSNQLIQPLDKLQGINNSEPTAHFLMLEHVTYLNYYLDMHYVTLKLLEGQLELVLKGNSTSLTNDLRTDLKFELSKYFIILIKAESLTNRGTQTNANKVELIIERIKSLVS